MRESTITSDCARGRAGFAASARAACSPSEINRLARELIEGNLPRVIVEGEISGLSRPRSGHWYFALKDRDAQLRCVMFRGDNLAARFRPADGDRAIARGSLTIYQKNGDFQLKVAVLERAGSGESHQAFELLKARLREEGLFRPETKQPVGKYHRHIGIVTSASGAVLRDILSVFRRRFPALRVTLIPAAVQGEQAPAEICRAIETANALRGKLGLEALIVGRGGGSPEDLRAFNEESVARAIFASELPVASAVGHETDFSIADFVADLRAPTPSAAAELMSPSRDEYFERLRSDLGKLHNRARHVVRNRQERLRLIGKRLRSPARRLEDHAQTLDALGRRMERAQVNLLARKRQHIDSRSQALRHASPMPEIVRLRARLDELPPRLRRSIRSLVERQAALLGELRRALHATSPLRTLARGYSISLDESAKVIRSVDDVTEGSRIVTRLADGRLESVVLKRENKPVSPLSTWNKQ